MTCQSRLISVSDGTNVAILVNVTHCHPCGESRKPKDYRELERLSRNPDRKEFLEFGHIYSAQFHLVGNAGRL